MKKLLYSIMALAGLTMASCTQEHIDVQYNPENVVAPVLGAIADVDFTKDEANIVVEYTNANFKVATSNSKDLYVDVKGNDFADKVKLNAEFNDKLTIKLTDLYAAVLSLGGKPGEDIDVDLMINAYLTTDKGAFIAGTESVSNIVSIKVKSAAFTAPVISDVADAVLKEDAADIVIDYTEADFNIATEHKVSHSLYVDLAGKEFKGKTMVDAKFEEGKITVKAADLNKTILNAGVEGGEAKDIDFAIIATVDAIAGASAMSNIDSANIKTYASNIIPAEKYAKMYVVGSLNGWDHANVAKEFDFLYNYNVENTKLYTGIIDLRKPDSAAEFKFTSGDWGKDEHSMTGENAAEASTITLVAGGGDNINVWKTKRFYGAELDLGGLTLKKLWSANQIGIIGLNGDWEKDIVMEYNAKWDRFYADIEAAADTEMKFRADGGWDLNWGVDCANGGDNIKVTAGKYRVYFNPVSGLIEFNAKAFNTTEDTEATGGATPEN